MIPLGLPGTFLQVASAAVLAAATDGVRIGWGWVGVFLTLALVGEGIEFLSGQWGARRFGGSRASAWGALVGGLVGAVVGGIPLPLIGSMIMAFVGTFVGALVGEMYARRAVAPDLRVALGAVLGRAIGVATKLSLAFVMLIVSIGVVIF
jgi:uncharacterized protein YqgC (DUF456 family)